MTDTVQHQTDQALDLHQAWFDAALQSHQLLQKQTDAWFDATRQISGVQRDTQQAFAKLCVDTMLRRSKT
ncbi:MAG: hypothetical protein ABMA64_18490 [Myxococcota bacterium]